MGREGLGANRARFELAEVWVEEARGRRLVYSTTDSASQAWSHLASRPLSDLIRQRLSELEGKYGAGESAAIATSLEEAMVGGLRELVGMSPASCLAGFETDRTTRVRLHADAGRVSLRFLTPARIRVENDLQSGLSFQLLVRSLLRRVSTLAAVHGGGGLELDYKALVEAAASVKARVSRLVWWDLDRYSNRQQTKLKLGGFIGEVGYEGEGIAEFLPLLIAGELLHVGTGTSFGLGKYEFMVGAR
jgi:hypothetical protein